MVGRNRSSEGRICEPGSGDLLVRHSLLVGRPALQLVDDVGFRDVSAGSGAWISKRPRARSMR